jgi:nitrate reductase delta subunit
METFTANIHNLLAEALCYPAAGQLAFLKQGIDLLPPGRPKELAAAFVEKIGSLSPGEWEELYTRTLDLSPLAAPYIGFQIWGESYPRGAFLSKMNRALMENEIDAQGDLPDHLIPVLRYLGRAEQPLPELVEALGPAMQRMIAGLRKADPANPYLDLFEAVQCLCSELEKEQA